MNAFVDMEKLKHSKHYISFIFTFSLVIKISFFLAIILLSNRPKNIKSFLVFFFILAQVSTKMQREMEDRGNLF